MSAPLQWEDWKTKPVTVQQVQFTGFATGNGYALLDWLHNRGIKAVRGEGDESTDIFLRAQERDDARAVPGCWFVIGTQNEVYPIDDVVHNDKYERAS